MDFTPMIDSLDFIPYQPDHELSPDYIYNIFASPNQKYSSGDEIYRHDDSNTITTGNIENIIFSTKHYVYDNDHRDKNKNRLLKALSYNLIERKKDQMSFSPSNNSIDNFFSYFSSRINNNKKNFQQIIQVIISQLEKDLKEMPIKPSNFPHYISASDSDQSQNNGNNSNNNNSQNDEEILSNIIQPNRENNNNNDNDNDDQSTTSFSLNDLHQFYDILNKYQKPFSFSPKFVNLAIKKFDQFLASLQSTKQDNQNQFNYFRNLNPQSEEFTKFKIILLIKMRLFMFIHRMQDFLVILLELIILDQIVTQKDEDDHYSFKNTINDILPKCSSRRSTIVKGISSNEILDFSFNDSSETNFILTKEGLFKIIQKTNEPIEFNDSSIIQKVEFPSECFHNINNNAKITFSNGVLFLFCDSNKTIQKVVVSEDEEKAKKLTLKMKKIKNAKEHSNKDHPKKKETKENKNANAKKAKSIENKMTKKKLREKEKKEKRQRRKIERYEDEEENDVDLEGIKIDISDLPVLSFGSYNNYIRIVQRKDDKKLILTNIDLNPNDRINYNFDDAFNITKTKEKFSQTQYEIEIQVEINDVLLSEDFLYFSSKNDSSFQQYLIFKDGRTEFSKKINFPFFYDSKLKLKLDNKFYLYILHPFDEKCGFSIDKMFLPETKHWFQSDNSFFIKYPYLQNLSNIIDNCSELLLNRNVFNSPKKSDLNRMSFNRDRSLSNRVTKPLKLVVSPEEMSSCVQHPRSIEPQLENIISLVKELKDENLKRFFISLFIKLTGIIFLYEGNKYSYNRKIEESVLVLMKKYRTFILDLYSLVPQSNSINSNIIIRESMLFVLSISAKLLFLPDSYQQLREIVDQILFKDDEISPMLLKSCSEFIFSNPSSLYMINQKFYENLMKYEKEININNIFKKNCLFVIIESLSNEEIVNQISSYFDVLFQHLEYNFKNETISIQAAEELLTYILAYDVCNNNIHLSLELEKKLIELCPFVFERISKIPEVIENDKEFLELNKGFKKIDIHKEERVVESKHPYNPIPVPIPYKKVEKKKRNNNNNKQSTFGEPFPPFRAFHGKMPKQPKKSKKFFFEDLATIDFGMDIDVIYIKFDKQSKIADSDAVFIYSYDTIYAFTQNDDMFTKFIKINSNSIRVAIGRNIKDSQEVKEQLWGIKMNVIGIKSDSSFIWKPNFHLHLYNYFINSILSHYSISNNSTKLDKAEKEFKLILSDNIIQGIKLEDIDNYEAKINKKEKEVLAKQQKSNKSEIARSITRGISRGIDYDSQEEFQFDDMIKKDFLTNIISIGDKQTPEKRFIDALYKKTAKQNRIPINKSTYKILESEHYFAACLLKQLGLITTGINFLQILNVTKTENIPNMTFPNHLLLIWKYIYSLRKTLFFEYQKSKSIMNTNSDSNESLSSYEQLLENVNQKCKLLLYSNPVLKYKEKEDLNNEIFESTAKLILSFITSKVPLSIISQLIDLRRKRLSISKQSIEMILTFFDKNLLFESSKPIFAEFNNAKYPIKHCLGAKQSELEKYDQLLGSLSIKMAENVFTQPSISMIKHSRFIVLPILNLQKKEVLLQISKILIDMLNRNHVNIKSYFYDSFNYNLIQILIIIATKTEDVDLINYIVSFLNSEEIDFESKKLILLCIHEFVQLIDFDDKLKIFDESFAFSILSNNKNTPGIIRCAFYWIAVLFTKTKQNSKDHQEFILKVLKGIGQVFTGKNCLFIDDSIPGNAQKSISVSMINFIRILFNNNNEDLFIIIHDILMNKINNINSIEEIAVPIGLFFSFGLVCSLVNPSHKMIPSYQSRLSTEYQIDTIYTYTSVLLENMNFELNEKEIDNILTLHEKINQSNHFNNFDENPINDKITAENMFIYSFYSFLPMIFQVKNNAKVLMNDKNLKRTLSFFEFSMKPIPTNDNSIESLANILISTINNQNFTTPSEHNNQFRFLRLKFGDISYKNGNENGLIKTDKNFTNIFISNRPFVSNIETYFEVKVNKIGNNNIFIGFVDADDNEIHDAFGFGSSGYKNVFCRKSKFLASNFYTVGDEIMKNEQQTKEQFLIKEGDKIGCYYTPDFTYLTINGKLTPYRNPNKSLGVYLPIIIIDNDDIELEIIKNATVVDKSSNQFDFLNIKSIPEKFFEEKDIKVSKQSVEFNSALLDNNKNYYIIDDTACLIGSKVYISKIVYRGSNIESIEPYPRELIEFKDESGIIKDIVPKKDNPYMTTLIVNAFSKKLLHSVDIKIDSNLVLPSKQSFLYMVEQQTKVFYSYSSKNYKFNLPKKLQGSSDFDSIKQYIRSKVLQSSTRSISILMMKYLVFILTDYLRYSKSKLLQDEGINSIETKTIIKALAYSLPSITEFNPYIDFIYGKNFTNKYIIFSDEQAEFENNDNNENENEEEEEDDDENERPRPRRHFTYNPFEFNDMRVKNFMYKIPGERDLFNSSFKVFLKESERFISHLFLPMLLKELYEITKDNSLSLETIYYDLISPQRRIESIYPLPEELNLIQSSFQRSVGPNEFAFIPILLSTIPDQLPSFLCLNKRIRLSSDQVSYLSFNRFSSYPNSWKYNIKKLKEMECNKNKSFDPKDYSNYKLRFGLLYLSSQLNNIFVFTPLGFIQTIFNLMQSIISSEYLYENLKDILFHDIIKYLFDLSLKKDPLIRPFIEPILISIISILGFSDYLFTKQASKSFSLFNSRGLYNISEFPNSNNELPLIFNIYSKLIQTKNLELSSKQNHLLIFNEYSLLNEELFKTCDEILNQKYQEGSTFTKKNTRDFHPESVIKKKKNYKQIYLLYYYSILLNNDNNIPYPKFLFEHDLIRQHFGGFRTVITNKDISKSKSKKINEIQYKSKVFDNEFDLQCSCNLINIFEKNEIKSKSKESINPPISMYTIERRHHPGYQRYRNLSIYNQIDDDNDDKDKKKDKKKVDENDSKDIYTVFVHQLNNDEKIELKQTGEPVCVSFPLEILICKKGDKFETLKFGDAFVINFAPSEEQHEQYFNDHFNEIQEDFEQFISIGKYDNELSKLLLESKDSDETNNNGNENDESFQGMNHLSDFRNRFQFIRNNNRNHNPFNFHAILNNIRNSYNNNNNGNANNNSNNENNNNSNNSDGNSNNNENSTVNENNNTNNANSNNSNNNGGNPNDNNDVTNENSITSANSNTNNNNENSTVNQNNNTNITIENTNSSNTNNENNNNANNRSDYNSNNASNNNNNTSNNNNNTSNNNNNTSNNNNSTSNNNNSTSNNNNNTNNNNNNTSNNNNSTSNNNNSTSNNNNNTNNNNNNTSNNNNNTNNNNNNTNNNNNNTNNNNNNTSNNNNNTNNNNNNTNNNNNNPNNMAFAHPFRFNRFIRDDFSLMDDPSDYKLYELEKIPKTVSAQLPSLNVKPNIIALRFSILKLYSTLIEKIMVNYSGKSERRRYDWIDKVSWTFPLSSNEKLQNLFAKQIIRPAYSMNTESKFRFINQIFMSEKKETSQLHVVFNRFEQQKFMEKLDSENNNNNNNKDKKDESRNKARPLFLQFMEQVDEDSISLLKVRGSNPFSADLVGENAIDAGGPGRELFASLIMEMMNEHIGIFTFNPNRIHAVKETNQEDLIPNKFLKGDVFSYSYYGNDSNYFISTRFLYAGALIAACIVSELPQQMKLASFIWEYLTIGTVSIKNIYEIDNNFKELIENAENLQERLKTEDLSEEEFESLFLRAFDINDSFDNVVELIPSGSKKRVTKENLNNFIDLAKDFRIHEFDQELKELKKGFDTVMCYKNITSILNPHELKLLACGEQHCSIEQMKKLCIVNVINSSNDNNDNQYSEKMKKMFWNVMESFSEDERMLFIRFSSGNMGLPAPGLKWEKDLTVKILPKENRNKMAIAHTCFSSVEIPYFESEEQLSKVLKISINFSGLITDSVENTERVAEFL